MPNPPKKIIPNANNCASFNEIKHRQNYYLIRTGAFTYAMVHLVSRATRKIAIAFMRGGEYRKQIAKRYEKFCLPLRVRLWDNVQLIAIISLSTKKE
jgi:hypothetical protein